VENAYSFIHRTTKEEITFENIIQVDFEEIRSDDVDRIVSSSTLW
jgi:hypothetical protein